MVKITSRAAGPRIVHHRIGKGEDARVQSHVIHPGETVDLELHNPNDPVYRGMVDKGELVEGDKAPKGSVHAERMSIEDERAQLEADMAELARRERELSDREHAERLKHDRRASDDRQAAMIAGHMRGLADPLPAGTDTEGGEESKAALERLGHDPKEAAEADPARGGVDAEKHRQQVGQAQRAAPPPKADDKSKPKGK